MTASPSTQHRAVAPLSLFGKGAGDPCVLLHASLQWDLASLTSPPSAALRPWRRAEPADAHARSKALLCVWSAAAFVPSTLCLRQKQREMVAAWFWVRSKLFFFLLFKVLYNLFEITVLKLW